MYVLGISAYFHDSAACLMQDGLIVAAAQEERFTRVKQDNGFPKQAIISCLKQAGITIDDVDYIGFYEKPLLKLERILSTAGRFLPRGFKTYRAALEVWLKDKLWLPDIIRDSLVDLSPSQGNHMRWDGRLIFCQHHMSHAASAFYPSPFEDAAILVLDGVGEYATTSLGVGSLDPRGVPKVELLAEIKYPHSLGLLYSAFTYYLGFKVNSGEYKLMGLAPYGEPKYEQLIRDELIQIRDDGSFRINLDYFSYPHDRIMINDKFRKLFFGKEKSPEEPFTPQQFDLAASIQKVIESAVLGIVSHLHRLTGRKRLCMAGGVALNCVANGRILREGPFDDLWVQPASNDSGGALGIAYHIWHRVLERRRPPTSPLNHDAMRGAYLGPSDSDDDIEAALHAAGLKFHRLSEADLYDRVCDLLAQEMVVGWHQGRMEFGPRALGGRSILGDPRSTKMQKMMNLKIKFRESFRPFAPSVLREHVEDWFEIEGRPDSLLGSENAGYDSPYMLLVAPVKAERRTNVNMEHAHGIEKLNMIRSAIPACTHVDYSARLHTIDEHSSPRYRKLLERFLERTGVPLLVNTSFNIRSEPIVCTASDSINCFLGTEMDALALGNYLVLKSEVPESLLRDYRTRFSPD